MTRNDVLEALNLTPSELADRLGRQRTTVAMWGADKPLPRGVQFEMCYRFPGLGLMPEPRYMKTGGGNHQVPVREQRG